MTFWVIAAGLTALATLIALWPLLRRTRYEAATRADHDVEVYGAQLRELEGDVARGTIRPQEAETARAEIGRRLLRAAERARMPRRARGAGGRKLATVAIAFVAIILPLTSAGLYVGLGSAGLPDRPLGMRMAESEAAANDFRQLVAQAEARLRTDPEDGRGWDVLAPIYLRMDRATDSATAFGNAIRILGPSAEREAGLGEALTQAAGGEVTDEARAAFERAVAIRKDFLPARFFLALDLSQEGSFSEAAGAWQELIERSPEGAPWLQIAAAALADARQRSRAEGAVAAAPVRGPTPADMAAAAGMPEANRQAMIRGMVSQLAERLQTAPGDVEGWKRLIRSYTVLGESDKALAALRQAGAAFPEGSGESAAIAALGRELGLPIAEETQ